MSDASIQHGPDVNGLRSLVLENNLLRVTILPEAGAKIWQIRYKPLEADLLWNNPSTPPAQQALHASYDDTWSGGWDELFPNDEAGDLLGHAMPDHGELWTGVWQAEPVESGEGACLRLQFRTPISRFAAEKILLLKPESAVVEVRYKLQNEGDAPFPFLFKLHPAFAVSTNHRIDFPPMTIRREPEFPGTLEGAPPTFPWPYVPTGGTVPDLRQIPDVRSGAVHFFYGTELAAGWCGVTDKRQSLAAALRFDPEFFSSCWLFATHGGWRDLNVAVLEPATSFPYKMQTMLDSGQARWLAAGESLETKVLLSVQEGLNSIGGIAANGLILPGDES